MAIACLFVATAAFAQQATNPDGTPFDPRQDARVKLSPFYFTPSMQIQNIGVDTNVFNSATDPQSDFTATLAPHVDLWVPFERRALLTTNATAGLVYYNKFSSERSVNPQVNVRGDVFLRKISLFVENDFLRSRQRPSFEIDARSLRYDNGVSAGLGIQIAPRLEVVFSAYDRKIQYDQDAVFFGTSLRESLNHTEQGLRLSVSDHLTSLTTLSIQAETEKARFVFSSFKNADMFKIGPAVDFKPKALISGSFAAGLRHFNGLDPALPDYTGLFATGELSYTFASYNKLGFTWNRDVAYSFEVTDPYYISNELGGTLRRQIAGNVDAIVSVDHARYRYKTFGVAPGVARQDLSLNYGLDVGYRLTRTSRIGFAVSKWHRTTTGLVLPNYNGLRAGISVTYGT